MRQNTLAIFATLVLFGQPCFSAPFEHPTIGHIQVSAKESDPISEITSWTSRVGLAYGAASGAIDTSTTSNSSIYRLFYQSVPWDYTAWEFSADITTMSFAGLELAKKYYYGPTGAFRPTYKFLGGAYLNPSENIASLIHFERFYVGAGAGIEYMLKRTQVIRFDVEGSLAQIGFHYVYLIGWMQTF